MKFDGNYFDTKNWQETFEKLSENREIRFFAAYTAVCWPARFVWNKFKLVIFTSTAKGAKAQLG